MCMTLLSKQLLIYGKRQCPSHRLVLLAPMARKAGVPVLIWVTVGAIDFGTVPFMIFHNFSTFNITVNL
jgi:hypothetical protein